MSTTTTYDWNPSEHLETREQMAHYLEAALEEGDSDVIAAALGDIARSKGMLSIAESTGFGRENIYKSFSKEGSLKFLTVLKIVDALGLKLTAVPSYSDKTA